MDVQMNKGAVQPTSSDQEQGGQGAVRLSQVLLLGLFLLVVFTRFWDLGVENFWYDEYIMVYATQSWDVVVEEINLGRNPVLTVVGFLWGQAFGYSEFSVRAISAISGILAVGVFYWLARRMYNERVALIAAALATFSGFLIWYAQDYRYYSVMLLLGLLSYAFLWQALATGKRWYFIPMVIANILMYFTHTFALFLFVGQGLFFLTRWFKYPRLRLAWVVSQIAIIAGIIHHVWVFVLSGYNETAGDTLSYLATIPYNEPIFTLVRFLAFDLYYFRPIPLIAAGVVGVGGTLVFLFMQRSQLGKNWGASWREFASRFTQETDATLMLLFWLGAMFLPWLLEPVLGPAYAHRYVIWAAPAFFLLLAVGMVTFRRLIPLYASVGALAVLMLAGLLVYYQDPSREDWTSLYGHIAANEDADDLIVISWPGGRAVRYDPLGQAYGLYYPGDTRHCDLEEGTLREAGTDVAFEECVGDADVDRFWVAIRAAEFENGPQRAEAIGEYLGEAYGAAMEEHIIFFDVQLIEFVVEE